MAANGKPDPCRLGFLVTVEISDYGYMGGLLVTNQRGRPLEFQCTTPVKPNDTQKILYGPTLRPFLLGELIGRTLVEKVGVKPDVVLTEQMEVLELRRHVDVPIVHLSDPAEDRGFTRDGNNAANTGVELSDPPLNFGHQSLRFHAAHATDRGAVEKHIQQLPVDADLREPFLRVREALQESMRGGASR